MLLIAVFYPQGGAFPFRWPALLLTLGVVAWVLVFVPVEQRLVRAAAVLYALAAVVAFVVPTPLGANLNRLGMYAAGPALLALVPLRRLLALVIPWLLFWQWSPALDAMLRAGTDPSTQQAYYRPLIAYLASVGAETGRVEIVPTARHWEAAYVASRFPIARGWERQLDIRFNPLFYEDGLTAAAYHLWLLESGVDRVAVPDAALDDSRRRGGRVDRRRAGLPATGVVQRPLARVRGHRLDGSCRRPRRRRRRGHRQRHPRRHGAGRRRGAAAGVAVLGERAGACASRRPTMAGSSCATPRSAASSCASTRPSRSPPTPCAAL